MLFDSTIVIDFLNGIPPSRELIEGDPDRAVSVVAWIEVLTGSRTPGAERSARETLARFEVLPLSEVVAESAIAIRRSGRMKLPDAIILATARTSGLVLVTRNTRDFPADDPFVLVPYTL